MSIAIELSPAQLENIQKQVMAEVKAKLLADVFASFNIKQLAGEVKNAVIREASAKIAGDIRDKYRESEIIHRALQTAESRVYNEINTKLKGGILVSFKEITA
jgi:replicative DNA helicase